MATRAFGATLGVALMVTLSWTHGVRAEPATEVPAATGARLEPKPTPDQARPPGPIQGRLLSPLALSANRGGTSVNDMKLRGVVADNQAINVSTGGNLISDGALSNAVGVPMVIQNTGNNVLIQNATILNVHVH